MNDNKRYIIRNYRPLDLTDYAHLKIAAVKLHPGGGDYSLEDIKENMGRPNYSPERDLFVIETAREIAGFIDITPELKIGCVVLDCLVLPDYRRHGLSRELLEYALYRARELKAKIARVNIGQDNTSARKVLPRLGFRMVRRFLELRRQIDDIGPPEVTQNTFICRHLSHGETETLTHLQNRCFTGYWGYNPNTAEEIAYYIKMSHGSPEDVILVRAADKPVGYCWTTVNREVETAKGKRKGCIYMLGTDPDYRGLGIGRIALLSGLAYLKRKGRRIVKITVDSENETARALYKSVDFKKWSSSLWYEKAID
ncbi:MAG: hypothetical protein CL874_01340 [Dehalococcoidales bacterium]|jgi:mycothiol synthase|nr:hypothetical protein [Dehalococcoidales bacterium]MDP6448758.1 GNAT family N-acetyltransferase [Dehalococcoidales bacterium]MDP6576248.1 GNAT family N-acetyltransferase [Dehalococcoidales bacterium]MDP6825188.1 GNAT family N-acetyltransferase [Dehalococcoidales bacterium]